MNGKRRIAPPGHPPDDPADRRGGPPLSGERIDLGESRRGHPVFRLLLLLCVFLGTIWVYSWHFENVAERMNRRDPISDETGTLTRERLELLREASSALSRSYGVTLVVKVRQGPVAIPKEDPKTLFIGLDTAGGTATVILPPLLAKALPEELAQSLQSGYFAPYLAAGNWPEGLYSAVLAILEALRDRH